MSRILVVGAGGFIGGRIATALAQSSCRVVCAGRDPARLRGRFPFCEAVFAELGTDDRAAWRPRLRGIDGVVNAAGVLRGDLDATHRRGPIELFEACAEANIARVVQISALGAGRHAWSPFLETKHAADTHLLALARERERSWCVVKPSLVIGRGAGSTGLFLALAATPFPIRLANGAWRVQPVHVDDLARAVVALLEAQAVPRTLDLVGPEEMTTDALTCALRRWLGLPDAPFAPLPYGLLKLAARAGDWQPNANLTTESLALLAAGNTADSAPLRSVLGWSPRSLTEALAMDPATAADLWRARLLPVRSLLVALLVIVWVGSGLVSLALPPTRSDLLLAGIGLHGAGAVAVTKGGAALDVALGTALCIRRWRRPVAFLQIAVMLTYTILASVALPGLWADPFGPLLKNIAVLAATLALLAME